MGCIQSSPDSSMDQQVTSELAADENRSKGINKLLLLGAGGSGKSTIFKQLQRVYGKGFAPKERASFKAQIYDQIIDQMQTLVAKCKYESVKPGMQHLKLAPQSEQAANFISHIQHTGAEVTSEIAKHIKILWNDPAVRAGFAMRAKFCVVESSGYFFDNVDRIAAGDYVPTDDDLLLTRHRTTGMTEKTFQIKGTTLTIVDVGGQRSERRKWIHCFEQNVTAVIYVTSLSSYDEVLYEDETKNDMVESLNVFNTTINGHWFKDTPFILFLNKSDLFDEKIVKSPLQDYFDAYEPTEPVRETALAFIRDQFESIPEDKERSLYTHVTCATNEDNITRVFVDVQHIIINESLQENGIV